MKKLFAVLLFCFFFSNISGQNIRFANTIDDRPSPYGFRDTTVFKLDANGNSVWVKDFTGYVGTSTYRNVIQGAAFDGRNIYVLVMQGVDFSGPPHNYIPSIFKLDTLGNVLWGISTQVFPGNFYTFIDIYPFIGNGVWVVDTYAPGFTHYGGSFSVSASGAISNGFSYWNGSVTSMQELTVLTDSSYVICSNHRPSSPGAEEFTGLTKFNRNGGFVWHSDYKSSAASGFNDFLDGDKVTCDSSGNLYLFGSLYRSQLYAMGIKLNSVGNVIGANYWPGVNPYQIQGAKFENGNIILDLGSEELILDTLLNSSCLTNNAFPITEFNSFLGGVSGGDVYSSNTFQPVNGTPFSYTAVSPIDICISLNMPENPETELLVDLYFDGHSINWKSEMRSDLKIDIYDLQARKVFSQQISSSGSLETSFLNSGIYLLKFSSDEKMFVWKIVKP